MALGLVPLLHAPGPDGDRAVDHPMGREHVERQAAMLRTVPMVRIKGSDASGAKLEEPRSRLGAVAGIGELELPAGEAEAHSGLSFPVRSWSTYVSMQGESGNGPMVDPAHCPICGGCRWVCENHPNRPWAGASNRSDACDCGAGDPCPVCNPVKGKGERPALPPDFVPDIDRDKGPIN
jgi:hypothetical protein